MRDFWMRALSKRARELPPPPDAIPLDPVPAHVLEGLRKALLEGETHYTERPGLLALREKIAQRLGRNSDSVVVTSGESEARYVAELASKGRVAILELGDALFREPPLPDFGQDVILVGSLNALPGLSSFRVGFVSAPEDLAPSIRSWKQALSICTAAPSQRAALLCLFSR